MDILRLPDLPSIPTLPSINDHLGVMTLLAAAPILILLGIDMLLFLEWVLSSSSRPLKGYHCLLLAMKFLLLTEHINVFRTICVVLALEIPVHAKVFWVRIPLSIVAAYLLDTKFRMNLLGNWTLKVAREYRRARFEAVLYQASVPRHLLARAILTEADHVHLHLIGDWHEHILAEIRPEDYDELHLLRLLSSWKYRVNPAKLVRGRA
ncbi:hypothetical protein F5Y04DRAFT_275899 [Hypomontagnella monticulosa]|nr:hypothetical protein F5Y04DRAFT_275899 [Hypomontagnella monticulosa]